jgi:aerobic carbon-monoxide dehydrogenase medium subunit
MLQFEAIPAAEGQRQTDGSFMKAPAVDYVRPRSLAEAVELLAEHRGEARVLAGGQSLVAMMNLRVASPSLLIDIARLPELAVISDEADAVSLGACVTHAAIEDGRVPDPSRGLMPRVAATLSYRAIRTRGTIGGSLALSDPAAEWPPVLTALNAEVMVCGPSGWRLVKCAEFTTGVFETVLAADEIIESVRIPKLSADARWGYLKLCRKSGEFASALAVAIADHTRGHCRVVLGAANGAPLVLGDTSRLVSSGGREEMRNAVAADLNRAADRHFDEFQRNLHMVAAMRAVQQVLQ